MNTQSAQVATICDCIDHCFAFPIWCEDFSKHVDPDDLIMGLDRAFDLVADATRLLSFLALRKLDDFFGGVEPKPDDLVASSFLTDVQSVLDDVGATLLTPEERRRISKGVAHLTEHLSVDPDSEVELNEITKRSIPVFQRLVVALRAGDTQQEAAYWLDRTEALIDRGGALLTAVR